MNTTKPDHWEIRRARRRAYAQERLSEAMKHLDLTENIFDNGYGVGMDHCAWKVDARKRVYLRMMETLDGARCSSASIAMVVGVSESTVQLAVVSRRVAALTPDRMDRIAAAAFRIAGVGANAFHTNLDAAKKNYAVWLMRQYQPDGLRMPLAQIAIRTYGRDIHGRPRTSSVCSAMRNHERTTKARAELEAAA